MTTYLRAGAYRATVTAKESNGHIGVAVTPAALATTPVLSKEGEARATLAAGKGAVVPLEIPQDGLYRIELLGVGWTWNARLEDAEGWPLTKPGKLRSLTRQFDKGAYRLVVSPEDVEARMVGRLTPIVTPLPLSGHGPHPLPFGAAQNLQWREPQASDAPRTPDVWRFSLAGEADVELSISEGMIAEVFAGGAESVAKAAGAREVHGATRRRRLSRRGAGFVARRPARLRDFANIGAIAAGRCAAHRPAGDAFHFDCDRPGCRSDKFGDSEMLGVLKDANGVVVEQLQGRADDWNIALSRRLPGRSLSARIVANRVRANPRRS